MTNSKPIVELHEGLEFADMKGIVSSTISIDQYRPKIGDDADTVVIAFTVLYEDAAKDLLDFIETGIVPYLDAEVSPSPNEEAEYKVFVEMERTKDLYRNIRDLLRDIDRVTSTNGDWEYVTIKLDEPRPFDKERFNRDIISDPELYRKKFQRTEADEIKERMNFLVKY